MRHLMAIVAFLPLVLGAGCGGAAPPGSYSASQSPASPTVGQAAKLDAQPAGAVKADAPEPPITRKIIYTAHIEVVVKDLDTTMKDVDQLIATHKGYIAKSETLGSAGSKRTATWTLKVPVEQFRTVVAALAALGNTTRNSSDSQDVTEEFVDLLARIKNLKAEEETLNKLLKEQAVRLDDVLKIREQITKVRGDIERAEGRLKYLGAMAAMSTVNLTAREDASYVPPTAPTFTTRIDNTFANSFSALTEFGKGFVLLVVALAPWLPFILVGLFGLRWVVRRLIRLGHNDTPRPAPPRARPVAAPAAPPSSESNP